jgi:flagellar protein FliO/FliZ
VSALGAYVLQAAITVLVIAALAVALHFLVRRNGASGTLGPLELWGRLPLEPRKAIYLVKLGEQVLVLGASEAGLRLLTTLNASDLPPPTQATPLTLTAALSRALGGVAGHSPPKEKSEP